MAIETKICGISTPEAVDAVANGRASHIGFIFFAKSPRHVGVAQAAKLADRVPIRVQKVAVTVDAEDGYLADIVDALHPDVLQLHGKETPKRLKELKKRFGLPVMKALAIREAADLEKVRQYEGVTDRFLFDAKPPAGSDLPGGNGVSFDWALLNNLRTDTPWMLSGGLDAGNIDTAVCQSGARAIDVSSGVEDAPGIKNVDKITTLLNAAAKIGL